MRKPVLDILLIEDDGGPPVSMETFLRDSGFSIEIANHTTQAFSIMAGRKFDCVLIGGNYPASAALEVVQTLKNRSAETAIIVVTPFFDEETAASLARLDVQEYMPAEETDPVRLSRAIRWSVMRKRIAADPLLQGGKSFQGEALVLRVAELESVNRELDAFNYMVAHDLRKPLTVINLLCQAIQDLCTDTMTEECRGYLQEAYDTTLKMSRFIDLILNFARLAHVDLHCEKVDLSRIANSVVAELRLKEISRIVNFSIAEKIHAFGDPGLLRIVLENLLGNAWKHTSRTDNAAIQFGSARSEAERTFFVRDNGAGFEMSHADKLFKPFQHLPGTEEFAGQGLGLATVERIIRRHGGRVWAEGKPGEGAVFFFTLPDRKENNNGAHGV